MRTIYKYQLHVTSEPQQILMHDNGFPVHIDMQNEKICIWAEVDNEDRKVERTFEIFGTGHEIPKDDENGLNYCYMGTVLDGVFVWHIYEVMRCDN